MPLDNLQVISSTETLKCKICESKKKDISKIICDSCCEGFNTITKRAKVGDTDNLKIIVCALCEKLSYKKNNTLSNVCDECRDCFKPISTLVGVYDTLCPFNAEKSEEDIKNSELPKNQIIEPISATEVDDFYWPLNETPIEDIYTAKGNIESEQKLEQMVLSNKEVKDVNGKRLLERMDISQFKNDDLTPNISLLYHSKFTKLQVKTKQKYFKAFNDSLKILDDDKVEVREFEFHVSLRNCNLVECEQCNVICKTKEELELHKRACKCEYEKSNGIVPLHWVCCNSRYSSFHTLAVHFKKKRAYTHPFFCLHCCKIFHQKPDLVIHMKIVVDDIRSKLLKVMQLGGENISKDKKEAFICILCTSVYLSKEDLLKHLQEKYGIPENEAFSYYVKSEIPTNYGELFQSISVVENQSSFETQTRNLAFYICNICGVLFKSFDSTKQHIVDAHKITMDKVRDYLSISSCLRAACAKFISKDVKRIKLTPTIMPLQKLISFSFLKINKNESICPICKMVFPRRSFMIRHRNKHLQVKKCSLCFQSIPIGSFIQHKKEHNTVICDECGKACIGNGGLRIHKQNQHSKTYLCDICGKPCGGKNNLDRHMETHGINTCTVCQKVFSRPRQLYRHIFHEHKNVGNPEDIIKDLFLCKFCLHSFESKEEKEVHQPVCTYFKCDVCYLVFKKKYNYEKHLRIRCSGGDIALINQEGYNCNVCSKQFSKELDLEHHMKILHINAVICNMCGEWKDNEQFLQHHTLSHLGVKCTLCLENFKTYKLLYDHFMSNHHDLGTPEQIAQTVFCTYCYMMFETEEAKVEHEIGCLFKNCEAREHNEIFEAPSIAGKRTSKKYKYKQYTCNICNITISARIFRYHLNTVHNLSGEYKFGFNEFIKK